MKTAKDYSTITLMLIVLFSLTSNNTKAQLKTPSSVGTYEKGTITLNKGKEIEVYNAKDLQSFSLENGQKFKKAKYVNPFATRKQDMLPKNLMLEVAAEGKITIYKKHHHTQGIVSSHLPDRTEVSDAEYAEWQENNFEILYQKEGAGAKNLSVINIKALVGDNEVVLANYNKDYYGFQTLFTKGPVFESSFQLDALEAFTKLVEDYNKY